MVFGEFAFPLLQAQPVQQPYWFVGPLLSVLLLVVLIIIALKFGKFIVALAVNSLVGLVLLFLLNFLPFLEIGINLWSILIVAFGGIPGLALLILLDLLGIAF